MIYFDPIGLCLLIFAAALAFICFKKGYWQTTDAHLAYPDFFALKNRKLTFRERFVFIPRWIYFGGLAFLAIAFASPYRYSEEAAASLTPQEGLAFYLVLDRSGSMGIVVEKSGRPVTRLDKMKSAATQLIQAFPKDLIGAIAFSRAAEVISPLSLDHKLLIKRINEITIGNDPQQGGTSIGYAIYKTANLIAASKALQEKAPYHVLSAFMIIITDGFQDPSILDKGNPLRAMELDEAADFAKRKHIKVYIVNIDPEIRQEKYAPNLREMQRAAESTGGQLFIADRIEKIEEALLNIPKQEMSKIYPESALQESRRIYLFSFFLGFGLFLLGSGLLIDHVLFRRAL